MPNLVKVLRVKVGFLLAGAKKPPPPPPLPPRTEDYPTEDMINGVNIKEKEPHSLYF